MLIFIIELPMTDKLAFENMTNISWESSIWVHMSILIVSIATKLKGTAFCWVGCLRALSPPCPAVEGPDALDGRKC